MNTPFGEKREIPAVCRRLALCISALFVVSASPQAAGGQLSTSAAADTNLLSAIVRAAISDAGRADLRVDPRPLLADGAFYTVQPEAIAPVSPVVVERRSAVIRDAGLRTIDATRTNQNKDCPGVFVIGKLDSLRTSNSHDGCPNESFSVLAIGLPRPGCDVLPGDEVYDLNHERAARGYWAARVIRTSLGPLGSSVKASDYVLAKRGDTWVVIRIVGLMYTE